jgi:hypothetical protein
MESLGGPVGKVNFVHHFRILGMLHWLLLNRNACGQVIHMGKVLEEGKPISEYGVAEGQVRHLVNGNQVFWFVFCKAQIGSVVRETCSFLR